MQVERCDPSGRKPKLTPHRYASPPFGELVAATGRKSRKCPSLCSNGFQSHNRYRTRTSLPHSPIDIKRRCYGNAIIRVSGKQSACAHAINRPTRFYALASWRTIGIKRTRERQLRHK